MSAGPLFLSSGSVLTCASSFSAFLCLKGQLSSSIVVLLLNMGGGGNGLSITTVTV